MKLLAQGTPLGTIGGGGLGPFGQKAYGGQNAGITDILAVISSIIGILTVIASIWFLFMILFAGYEWISAGGDSKKLEKARDRITHAFVGLVIVVGAWSLTAVAGQFFGYNTLVNPNDFIQNLQLR